MALSRRISFVSALILVVASSALPLTSLPSGAVTKNGLKAPTSRSVLPHFTVPNCSGARGLALEESCLNGIL